MHFFAGSDAASARRLVHPGAWWLWAIGLAVGAMRTTNPVLLLLIAAVAGVVVSCRRVHAPWSRSFGLMARLALLTVLLSVALQVVLGVRTPSRHVLVTLPSLGLPSWAQGLTLGGPVSAEAVVGSATTGLRLAVLIVCVGAANSLAHPRQLLKALPAALYAVGVAAVVALTFVPQLAESTLRVRRAQRLRGRSVRGLRGVHGLLVPVLEEGLERAIMLAASMDSRGYGRRTHLGRGARAVTGGLVLLGLTAACVGTYVLVDPAGAHLTGLVTLAGGTAIAGAGSLLAGRRVGRTRYRTLPWRAAEWLLTACGAAVAIVIWVTLPSPVSAGTTLRWPELPLLPLAAVMLAALPAFATPEAPIGARALPVRAEPLAGQR